jgi:hypothetical protein
MATTTTNFGWDIPQSTDLVKDGATAIAALGQDIDTALVDLKGGTTGQVLAKASGTDLDFSWVAQDDSNAIQNAIVDAKGDLIGATAADTQARLAVGTNGQVLTADSTAATGLAWATAGSTFAGCRLEKSANQSISNSTDTALTWDTETFDTDTFHSTSTNTSRITIPAGKAGYYQFNVNIGWGASSTGIRDLNISKNGTRFQYFTFNGQASNAQSFAYSAIAYGAVNDYFEIVVFQNSGGALNIQSNVLAGGTSSFSCAYLGA